MTGGQDKLQAIRSVLIACLFTTLVGLIPFFSSSANAQQATNTEALNGENILSAQIVANASAVAVTTPWSNQRNMWSSDHGWQQQWPNGSYRSSTTFLLIKIDQALVEAAVQQWSSDMSATPEEARRAMEDLRGRYLRDRVETFVFFAPPLSTNPTYWAFSLPDFQQRIRQRTFSGSFNGSEIIDACSTDIVYSHSPSFICLVGFPQRDQTADPYYYVETYVRFFISSHPNQVFVPAVQDARFEFRVELGEVPLVAMVRRGIEWDRIRENHLDTHVQAVSAVHGDAAATFILDVGVRVVSGLLLRGLRIR